MKKKCRCVLKVRLGCSLAVVAISSALAAPPANDNFEQALVLRGLIVSTSGHNLGATTQPGEPSHAGSANSASVWWRWMAPSSGPAVVTTFGSSFDTVLAVYTGLNVSNLSLVAANDDFNGSQSRVEFQAAAGTTYHIAVGGWAGAQGNISLSITGTLATVTTLTLVPTGSVWRYLDDGTDQGTAWRAPGFNDSHWPSGPAELGFGDAGEGRPEATVLARVNSRGTTNITFYFRHAFVVTNPAAIASLTVRLLRDDGAAVYLNGVELVRDGLPPNAGYLDFATITVAGEAETIYYEFSGLSAAALVPGTNVLAAEVHQVNLTSSDISFDLELRAQLILSNAPPLVSLTAPAAGAVFGSGATVRLEADAYDSDGAITNVEFYAGTVLLGQDASHPYGLLWSNVPAGAYALRAVATDQGGLRATSAPVNITVTNNPPPQVAITSPSSGQNFVVPGHVTITATASDENGVARVEFYRSGLWLGQVLSPPYTLVWSNAVAGTWSLVAVAVDTIGARGTSAPVAITITGNYPPTVVLTSPTNQAVFLSTATVPLAASASDYDGTVSLVEFYTGPTRLGQASAAPFQLAWTNPPPGPQVLTAVATDNGGLRATSAPVQITVVQASGASGGLAFDGLDDYVTFGVATNLGLARFTVETWFYWRGYGSTASSGSGGVVGHPLVTKGCGEADGDNRDANYFLAINAANRVLAADFEDFRASANNNPVYGRTPVASNRWHHAAVTYDGTNWALYLDGVLEATAYSGQTPRHDSIQHAALGTALNSVGSPSGYFAGVLDEVRIWNYARSAAEIASSWNRPISSAPGLIARWPLDETSGTIARDWVGTTHGTLVNGPVWTNGYPFAVPPVVTLTSPTDGAMFLTPTNILLAAHATDADGTVTNVTFLANGLPIGLVTAPPFSLGWTNPAPGYYGLVAVATDNMGLVATSAPVNIQVQHRFVQVTSPTNGARFVAPDPITLRAETSDAGGVISRVEFFNWTTLLGQTTSRPFSLVWTSAVGTHQFSAVAVTTGGIRYTSAPVAVVVGANQPPTVAITAPADGTRYYLPATVDWTAQAQDPDGTVVRVEFWVDGTKRFEDPSPPYYFAWTNPPLGSYTLRVVAIDDRGLSATSAPVRITVTTNLPPTVALVSPQSGAAFIAPADITLSAEAWDVDGISQVRFLANGTNVGTVFASPYTLVWRGVAAGDYQLVAVATDGFGLAATSAPVSIKVTNNSPPVVAILTPTNNTTFPNPTNILIEASASDPDGISRVEFFSGPSLIGFVTAPPWRMTWFNVSGGAYLLTAVATDGAGVRGTSAPVNVAVAGLLAGTNYLINFGAVWKYLDNGSDQGTAWRLLDFDDSGWASGPAELGYGDGDEVTVVGYGPDPNNKYITTYFRHRFVVLQPQVFSYLNLRLKRDDGGVVYLNGVEVHRGGMPDGPINYLTLGYNSENVIDTVTRLPNLLVPGTNIVAVEIHQQSPSSSDISFDFELAGVIENQPPTVFLTQPTSGATFTAPTNILLEATATDADGTVARVEFFVGTNKISEATSPPYRATWSNVTLGGLYTLLAVATDNLGLRATSAPVTITVVGNLPPTVAITNPPPDRVYVIPTSVLIEVSASDSDGTISLVQLFADNMLLGQVSAPPFRLTWTNTTGLGTFLLTAIATDNAGARATSAPVRILFLAAPPPDTLIAAGSIWKYLDDGSNQGTAWRGLDFDDSTWPSGAAQLGVGDGDEVTLLRYRNANNEVIVTYYFRQAFIVVDPSRYKSLLLRLLRDDGAVVYLNGVEVWRSNMPEPPAVIDFQTLASTSVGGADEQTWFTALAPASLLRPGRNVVAVEVHQATRTSSDISFDFEMIGNTTNALPTVFLTSPAPDSLFNEPADILLTATASDTDGSVTNVQFFAGETLLAEDATAPFSFLWAGVPVGIYLVRAVAMDNLGDTATSAVVRVFVAPSLPPTVAAWAPPPGLVSNLTQITVTFTEPVDGVNAADLLINGAPASAVSSTDPTTYTFRLAQLRDGPVVVSWAAGHGIVDRESPPKPFAGTGPGETAHYVLVDTVPPVVTGVRPSPGATVPMLRSIEVTFSEPVSGVAASNLLVNGVPADRVQGALAGPYVFELIHLTNDGPVSVAWATNHLICDLAAARNRFSGGSWTYTLASTAPETNVVINEIMYHPASENVLEEYIELYNRGSVPLNLTGWEITGGVSFQFPPVTLPAGAYLVVAADGAAFRAKYPLVTNVVGGWVGRLSNQDDEIRLRNALGQVVREVHYATEGDWAIRQRGPLDINGRGWEWFAAHDGNVINTATGQNEGNRSLELVNLALPDDNGQNWAASTVPGGTPGSPNSTARTNSAPLIYEVAHYPPVPRSTNWVTISARIVDEVRTGLVVQLYWRNVTTTSPTPFTVTNMFDTGAHGDGLAGDGVYAVALPPMPHRTIIDFYVSATDALGQTRTWPAPARLEDGTFAQAANALYQVDDENYTGPAPIFRLVATAAELAEFDNLHRDSDAEMNGTLITTDGTGTRIRYNVGWRNRGAGTRSAYPRNLRINIPTDRPWNRMTEININSQYSHAQVAGSAFALRSGMPCAGAWPVQLRWNGVNRANAGLPQYGHHVLVEPINDEWARRHFPDDPNGNVYRGSRYPWTANLSYRGTNPLTYINEGYSKTSNQSENDWTDLINLTWALNDTNNPAYVQGVERHANVRMFMRYFAVCTLLDYMETSLCRGVGDDYAMYRGLKDPRFLIIPHDFDTILGQGDTAGNPNRTLFPMLNPPTTDPTMRANFLFVFMRHPAFVPLYYEELLRLLDTTFHPAQMSPMLDSLLASWAPAAVPAMRTFVTNRWNYARTQIPTRLTVNHTLSMQGGYPYTAAPFVTLWGRSHAARTRSVRVAGSPAHWSAFDAAWTNTVTLQPGLNRVLVQAIGTNNIELERTTVDIWYDDGSVLNVSGTLSGDTVWTAGLGPYQLTGTLTVPAGVTLTIQPGTTVYLGAGVNLVVANGGRLLAEGTPTAPIRFSRVPGSSGNWGGIIIQGGPNSPESRLTHAHLEFNGNTAIEVTDGTVYLAHLSFGNTARQYLSLDRASFVVEGCVFPSATAEFHLVQGTGGIKSNGRGIFVRNLFGAARGASDAVRFSGGQRPGPIVQFISNVFVGSGDDLLDLNDADAWIEGNVFLGAHRNGSLDTAGAISAGAHTTQTPELSIVRNIFYDCDHAAVVKQGGFVVLLHNTILRQTHFGGTDTAGAVLALADSQTTEGAGAYLEGNIIWDAEALVRNRTNALVTFTNNLLPMAWTGPGGGNLVADPLFRYVPALAETTNFTSWAAAQVFWDWFSLRPGSPAQGAGAWGQDLGAVVPAGVWISGEPSSPTPRTEARLVVGWNRTGSGIPTGANQWPAGAGYTHYRWRLDGGNWSAETPITQPIQLTNLALGAHMVEVAGCNDAGLDQDDPVRGPDGRLTVSRTWVVNPNAPALRLNEVLARNDRAVPVAGRYPDLVELVNVGAEALDLTGVSLTDNFDQPRKFAFPPGTWLGPGKYLVLYADTATAPPGFHLGFGLKQEGDDLYLFGADGRLLDAVRWGPQLPDLSIGRLADGSWGLTVPTFGAENIPARTGDPRALRLNEWLVVGNGLQDFIELFNPDPLPVNLTGLWLSDAPQSGQRLEPLPALSFIAGGGYLSFIADGDRQAGPTHLGFRLAAEHGLIGLFGPDLSLIDLILYGPQTAGVSQGRSPNGSSNIVSLPVPTPGVPNWTPPIPPGQRLVISELLAKNIDGLTNRAGRTAEWLELYNPTAAVIDLSGMSLTDTLAQPRKFVFPAGVQLVPGARLLVWCDATLPASTTSGSEELNTGFGLKANGGQLYLFNPPSLGGGLVDEIAWGVQAKDFSIGRLPDSSTNWVLCLPSPRQPNVPVAALGDPRQLRINEWMAAPASGDDWFELYNPQPQPVALGGLWLTDDIRTPASRQRFQIRPLSFIGTGLYGYERFVADGDVAAGPEHTNFRLAASGETLGVSWPDGTLIDGVVFGPQQTGVSEGRLPDGATTIVRFPLTPTPGDANYLPLTNVVINEVLSATPPGGPLEDAIELLNVSTQPVDLSGWWLSDARRDLKKYRIPNGVVLPPGGFVVFYESTSFNALPDEPTSFQLNGTWGDQVYLSAATPDGELTGWRAAVAFGPAEPGVSFGRYTNSVGQVDFVVLSARTFGADHPETLEEFRTGTGLPNAYPRVGPVVFNEIMYHPPNLAGADNVRDEFIELFNPGPAPVPLFDPARPQHTWRLYGGVDLVLPMNLTLPPGGYLVAVSFNPVTDTNALAGFLATYQIAGDVILVGPWSGKLDNGGEEIELQRPAEPDGDQVPYITVERVVYDDVWPWDPAADGTGWSLHRQDPFDYGNDPGNWRAGPPSPGPRGLPLDADRDGMPDAWEQQYGLDPNNPADAAQDLDRDGLSNLQEYLAGTDPTDPRSVLRLEIGLGSPLTLQFMGQPRRTYTILYRDGLDTGTWQVLRTLTMGETAAWVQLNDAPPASTRFYRLRIE